MEGRARGKAGRQIPWAVGPWKPAVFRIREGRRPSTLPSWERAPGQDGEAWGGLGGCRRLGCSLSMCPWAVLPSLGLSFLYTEKGRKDMFMCPARAGARLTLGQPPGLIPPLTRGSGDATMLPGPEGKSSPERKALGQVCPGSPRPPPRFCDSPKGLSIESHSWLRFILTKETEQNLQREKGTWGELWRRPVMNFQTSPLRVTLEALNPPATSWDHEVSTKQAR